jgi:hypothetical protein
MQTKIVGDQFPRLQCIPDYGTSKGEDCIGLAHEAGLDLDPWQQYVLTNSLGIDSFGQWAAFQVLITVPRQNGKGSILEARELGGLVLFKTDRLIIHTAHESKTASEQYLRVWSLFEQTPGLSRRVGRHSGAYGREFIELKAQPTIIIGSGGKHIQRNGRKRLIFIARTGGSGRGFTADCVVYDEDMFLDAGKIGASLPSLFARPNPQVIFSGSAGLKNSTQLARVRRAMVAGTSKRLAGFEYSINPHDDYCEEGCTKHDDPDDIRSIGKANPGLGIRLDLDTILAASETMDKVEYEREVLGVGQYPAPLDGWAVVPKKWYLATADEADQPPRVEHPIFALGASHDRSAASIAVAGLRSDGLVGVQVVEHREGIHWLVARAKAINDQWHPEKWVVDKRSAAGSLISELEKAGLTVEVVQTTDVTHACGQLFDAFRDDTLRHYKQGSLKTALAGIDKRNLIGSWAFDWINAGIDVSPLMAVTFAYWGYQRFGVQEQYDVGESVHFDLDEIKRYWRAGVYGPEDIRRLYDEEILDEKDLEALANDGIHP